MTFLITKYGAVILAALLIGGGAVFVHDQISSVGDTFEDELLQEGTDAVGELERELTRVLDETGSIAPERAAEIERILRELEERGVAKGRIDNVRHLLDQLKVDSSQ